jgi:hypothetical protein
MIGKTMTKTGTLLIVLTLVVLLVLLAVSAVLSGPNVGINAGKQLGVKGDAGILPDKSTHSLSPDGGQLIPLSEPYEGRVNA